jgi:protein gp37
VSQRTGIEWTDATWNPVVGCERISPGCAHCYAKAQWDQRHEARKKGKHVAPQYAHPFEVVQLKPERLGYPLSWRAPKKIFVNSVSDLFHDAVPEWFIARVFAVMTEASRHTFQVLTKRPARMRDVLTRMAAGEVPPGPADLRLSEPRWPLPNVWVGTSVENQRWADERIPELLATPAAVRFLSCEPLLGYVDLWSARYPLPRGGRGSAFAWGSGVQWVIAGGESGPDCRPCDERWLCDIRDGCVEAGVPFFLKQLGGHPNKRDGDEALLEGARWAQFPATAEVVS